MFKRGKSLSQVGLVSKQLFQQELQPFTQTNSSYAPGTSAQLKSSIITDRNPNFTSTQTTNNTKFKSFSSSSNSLFVKARSVGKDETFLNKKGNSRQSLSTSKDKMTQHVQDFKRLKQQIIQKESQIQRKLLIKRVLSGEAANNNMSILKEIASTKLSLATEKRNVLSILSSAGGWKQKQSKQIEEHSNLQLHQQIQKPPQLFSRQFKREQDHYPTNQQLRPESSYSLVNNESLKKSEVLGRQQLKLCLSEMELSLKQSIRQEIEGAYIAKEKQSAKSYQQSIKGYDSRLQVLQQEVAKRSELQQKALESLLKTFENKIQEVITKKLEQKIKTVPQETVSPFQPLKKQIIKQPVRQSHYNQRLQSAAKIGNQQNQIEQAPIIEEVKTFDPRDTSKQLNKVTQPQDMNPWPEWKSKAVKDNRMASVVNVQMKSKNAPKTNKNNIFEQASIDYQNEIEQIKLTLQSRNLGVKGAQNSVMLTREIDRSFQMPNKHHLNDSFQSQHTNHHHPQTLNHPKTHKQEKSLSVNNFPQQNRLPPASRQIKKQAQVDQAQQSQDERRKSQLRKILMKLTSQDPYLTSLGQVVSYCSKLMKKSKLRWRLPSLLLYRLCYDGYRLHTPYYEEGLKLSIIKEEDVLKFKGESGMLWENMMKVLKATIKKNEIDAQYQKLVQSQENMVEKLKPLIEKEVKQFIDALWDSEETSDFNILQCGLRMINGVFTIRKLYSGLEINILEKIEELGQKETRMKFEQWVNRLDQLVGKG